MVLAVAALIVALAGTAVAVDKIGSSDIAKNAVRSKHIKDRQVKSRDADLLRHKWARAEQSRLGSSTTRSLPGDPRLALRAKAGDILFAHGRVDIRTDAGAGRCNAYFDLRAPGGDDTSIRFAAAEPTSEFATVFADPEQDVVVGTDSLARAEGRELPILRGGTYRLTLSYDSGNATTDCTYRNRAIWLGIIR